MFKNRRTLAARSAPWARRTLSALLVAAASPATAGEAPARDAVGNPVRSLGGDCVDVASAAPSVADPRCDSGRRRMTYRILQNLVPQPSVTYAVAEAEPGAEVVRFTLGADFVPGHSSLTLELRQELLEMLLALEGYWYVDRFELVVHPGERPDPGHAAWLADKRLAVVRDFLLQRGVVAPMIEARVAPAAEPSRQQRVEVAVTVRGRR